MVVHAERLRPYHAPMRVLVTGGAGFIGSHLADRLLAAGHEVCAYDSLDPQVHPTGAPDYLDPAVELIVGDVFLVPATGVVGTPLAIPAGLPPSLVVAQSAIVDSSPLGLALGNAALLVTP